MKNTDRLEIYSVWKELFIGTRPSVWDTKWGLDSLLSSNDQPG